MIWMDLLRHLDEARVRLRPEPEQASFVAELDKLRIELRRDHGKELSAEISEDDALKLKLVEMIGEPIVKPPVTALDDVFACAPEETIPEHKIQDVVYRGDGEGRMVILKRDTPLIIREPDLVEVTEEELAK